MGAWVGRAQGAKTTLPCDAARHQVFFGGVEEAHRAKVKVASEATAAQFAAMRAKSIFFVPTAWGERHILDALDPRDVPTDAERARLPSTLRNRSRGCAGRLPRA